MALTPDEERELAALEAQVQSTQKSGGLTPDEEAEMARLEAELQPGMLRKYGAPALKYTAKGLDYLGGVARTGVGEVADMFVDGNNVTGEDWGKAFTGEAPGTGEYMDRLGVPEGGKINLMPEMKIPLTDIKLGEGESSYRDIGGFFGDVVLDPLTYATFGASTLAKKGAKGGLRRLLRPASDAAESGGKAAYKSAFKKIDEKLIEKNTRPLSEVMFKNGAWGSEESMAAQAKALGDKLMTEREGLYGQVEKLGGTINVERAAQDALLEAQRIKGIRGAEDLGAKLEAYVESFYKPKANNGVVEESLDWTTMKSSPGRQAPLSISEASDLKTRFYDSLPESAYSKLGKLKGDAKRVNKKMDSGEKNEIEATANSLSPSLGNKIQDVNADIGSIIGGTKPLANEVRKANTKNAVSSVDAGMVGYAITDPITGLPILLSKKLGDAGKMMSVRTGAGLGLNKLGKSGALDVGGRKIFIEGNEEPTPWELLQRQGIK
jgi:hypothetical protein